MSSDSLQPVFKMVNESTNVCLNAKNLYSYIVLQIDLSHV